jgi:hypothetical protein
MAPRRRDLGELSPRLLELSAKTTPIEPYPVTDKIVILPQTKKRREDLHSAHNTIIGCQAKLNALLKRAEDFGDANDEAGTEEMQALERTAADLSAEVESATQQYNRAFFGDAYDDIMALSEEWPAELWDDFVSDAQAHFMGGVNPPPDGTDETGAVVDEDEAGKALSSST